MKKKLLFVLFAIFILLLSGCGDDSVGNNENKKTDKSGSGSIYFERYSSFIEKLFEGDISVAIVDFNYDDIPELVLQDETESYYICFFNSENNTTCTSFSNLNNFDLYLDIENNTKKWLFVENYNYCYADIFDVLNNYGVVTDCKNGDEFDSKLTSLPKYDSLGASFILHEVDKSKLASELKRINTDEVHYKTKYDFDTSSDDNKNKHLVNCYYFDSEDEVMYISNFYYDNNKLSYFETHEIFELTRPLTDAEESKSISDFKKEDKHFQSLTHDYNLYNYSAKYNADEFYDYYKNDGEELDFTYDGVDSFIHEFEVDDTTCRIIY